MPRSRRDDCRSIPWIARLAVSPAKFRHRLLFLPSPSLLLPLLLLSSRPPSFHLLFSPLDSRFFSRLSFLHPSLLSTRLMSISTNPLHAHTNPHSTTLPYYYYSSHRAVPLRAASLPPAAAAPGLLLLSDRCTSFLSRSK